jgi:hypothetical protein
MPGKADVRLRQQCAGKQDDGGWSGYCQASFYNWFSHAVFNTEINTKKASSGVHVINLCAASTWRSATHAEWALQRTIASPTRQAGVQLWRQGCPTLPSQATLALSGDTGRLLMKPNNTIFTSKLPLSNLLRCTNHVFQNGCAAQSLSSH